MRIAYWTIDDVNLCVARDLAEAHDATIDHVMGREKESPEDADAVIYDAVLYDLDFIPNTMREEILARLALAPVAVPVAVHSYNLDEAQIESLLARGVAVYRRLESEVFGNLRDADSYSRSAPAIDFREIDYAVSIPS